MKFFLPLLIVALFSLNSCVKRDLSGQNQLPSDQQTVENMKIAPSFTFKTDKTIDVRISTLDNSDQTVPNIRVNLYTDFPENGGSLIASCYTGSTGVYTTQLKLPSYTDSLVVETPAIGFVQLQKRAITDNKMHCVLGGKNPLLFGKGTYPGILQPEMNTARIEAIPFVKPLSSFNALGVPSVLSLPNDVVDAAFLADINTALPEYKPVPTFHPTYLTQSNQANLEFLELSNVWVTFVHEGAGHKNVLCYYKYDVNNPPATAADVDTLYAIFPNTSYVNSGGGLVSGNKVSIGLFQPGTAVGWALISNGYNGSAITAGAGVFYSNTELNPEATISLKKHCIMLNDVNRGKFLLSFEDLNRGTTGCDNDFNDAIFYVSADPVQAIVVNNVPLPAYTSIDDDNDGVTNNFDDYPTDPNRAFDNFYPSQNAVGTLAFEDQWPSKGDYDFNDMVIDYNFNTITNAQNQVTQIRATITTKAIGASYHSGFGFQLPIDPSLVASVTGTDNRGNLITRNANGTEAGQSKATIIVYEDAFTQLPWPGGGIGVNTTAGAPYVQPKTLNVVINLTTPVNTTTLGLPPYNAFIFTNKNRANEVHLINFPPTDLANRSLLGTMHDNSNPATGRYYVTAKNLPFAIDVAGPFDYSVEKTIITDTYTKFYQWGVSGGLQFLDWYKPVTGYRNTQKIFTH
jgi:LruC domain-containing protein